MFAVILLQRLKSRKNQKRRKVHRRKRKRPRNLWKRFQTRSALLRLHTASIVVQNKTDAFLYSSRWSSKLLQNYWKCSFDCICIWQVSSKYIGWIFMKIVVVNLHDWNSAAQSVKKQSVRQSSSYVFVFLYRNYSNKSLRGQHLDRKTIYWPTDKFIVTKLKLYRCIYLNDVLYNINNFIICPVSCTALYSIVVLQCGTCHLYTHARSLVDTDKFTYLLKTGLVGDRLWWRRTTLSWRREWRVSRSRQSPGTVMTNNWPPHWRWRSARLKTSTPSPSNRSARPLEARISVSPPTKWAPRNTPPSSLSLVCLFVCLFIKPVAYCEIKLKQNT